MIDPRGKWCPIVGENCAEMKCFFFVEDAVSGDAVQAACTLEQAVWKIAAIETKRQRDAAIQRRKDDAKKGSVFP